MSEFTPKQHKLVLTELSRAEQELDKVLFARNEDDDDSSPYLKAAGYGAAGAGTVAGGYFGAQGLAAKGKRINTMPTAVQKTSLVPASVANSQILSGPQGAGRFSMIPAQSRVTNTVAQPGVSKGFLGDLSTGSKRLASDTGESIVDVFKRLLKKAAPKAVEAI